MLVTRYSALFLAAALLGGGGCSHMAAAPANAEAINADSSANRARSTGPTLIVDTHIDAPFRLHRAYADLAQAVPTRDFDYPRAKAGGLNGAFMSIYIPAAVDEAGEGAALADKLIDDMEALVATNPDKFAIATCAADIQTQANRGVISLPLGMENGGPMATSPEALGHFFNRGIRYVTLAHSKSNALSDSSYDPNEVIGGLSVTGKTLVARMNELGIMIDVSHISDAAFEQVIDLSKAPVIASHSSLRHFVPGFHRNMSDAMVQRLAAAGGVIQINFGSSFVSAQARAYSDTARQAMLDYQQSRGLARDAEEMAAFRARYRQENPYPFATLDTVLDHIDRTVALAGIDAVGIGSDYDGVGDTLPVGLKDVSTYPNLMAGLRERGYSQQDIDKIMGGNLLRVWRAVEAYAATRGTAVQCAG